MFEWQGMPNICIWVSNLIFLDVEMSFFFYWKFRWSFPVSAHFNFWLILKAEPKIFLVRNIRKSALYLKISTLTYAHCKKAGKFEKSTDPNHINCRISSRGNGTCQLSSKVVDSANNRPKGTIFDPDFDLYARKTTNCFVDPNTNKVPLRPGSEFK